LTIFFFIFLNFFDNFFFIFFGLKWCQEAAQKFQIFLINEQKVMPVLPKVSQVMFSGRHNTTVRAKRP
jgi:hypothetical protein